MSKKKLKEKERIGLYPGFGTSTHDLLHKKLIKIVGARPITWHEIYTFSEKGRLEKISVYLISIIKFMHLNLQRQNRNCLRYRGIVISHAVIEFGVRLNEIGRFIFFSKRTFIFIKQTILFVRSYINFTKQFDIALLIGGDDGYIEGSILGQLALKNNIRHLFLKENSNFLKKNENFLSGFKFKSETLSAGPNFKEYSDFFSAQNLDNIKISEHENELTSIVMGESYYPSIRNKNADLIRLKADHIANLKEAIVLFLHDFIDSPGVYGKCVFHDQWKWIEECVKITSQNKVKLVIKIHPGVNKSNLPAINELKEKYKFSESIFFLEERISLYDLKQAGIKGVLTLFGSVIVEAAFLGIPCISASNNPYVAFAINVNTETIKQFRLELRKLCRDEYIVGKNDLKVRAIQAYLTHKLFYKQHSLVNNFPYDDVNAEIFQSIYPNIPDAYTFGIYERRDIFLYDGLMAKYVSSRLEEESDFINERFELLMEQTMKPDCK